MFSLTWFFDFLFLAWCHLAIRTDELTELVWQLVSSWLDFLFGFPVELYFFLGFFASRVAIPWSNGVFFFSSSNFVKKRKLDLILKQKKVNIFRSSWCCCWSLSIHLFDSPSVSPSLTISLCLSPSVSSSLSIPWSLSLPVCLNTTEHPKPLTVTQSWILYGGIKTD